MTGYEGKHRLDGPEPECTCTPVVELTLGGADNGNVSAFHEDDCAIMVGRRERLHLTQPPASR